MGDPKADGAKSDDWGKFILRLSVGGLMLFHGVHKLMNGTEGISAMIKAKGLPEVLTYGVYVGEVLAPVLLIVGFATRLSALVVAGTMVMAIYLAHSGDVLKINDHGAWAVEHPALFGLGALAVALLGPGKIAAGGGGGDEKKKDG
ncbi:MAG: DoxX family protein [Planctomycetota bacterium]